MTLEQELKVGRLKELELLGEKVPKSYHQSFFNRHNLLRAGAGLGILLAAILGIKTCTCVCSSTVSGISGVVDSEKKYFPEGFKEIYLGMSYEKLQKVRPSIKSEDRKTKYELIKDKDEIRSMEDFDAYRSFFSFENEGSTNSDIMSMRITYHLDEENNLERITFSAQGWQGGGGDMCQELYTNVVEKVNNYSDKIEPEEDGNRFWVEQTWNFGNYSISVDCNKRMIANILDYSIGLNEQDK